MNCESVVTELGSRLRAERKKVGMSQDAVGTALGMKPLRGHACVSKLEKGVLRNVSFLTVVRYLEACKAPIGKFVLDLIQSGASGEAEAEGVRGFTSRDSPSSSLKLKQAKRAKGKLLYQKRWEREARDAEIIAGIWREVQAAIQPVLPADDPTRRFLAPYLVGVRTMFRAWKLAVRGAVNKDPTLDVEIAFDRIERAGLEAKTVPAAVHKTREVVFARLMAMVPR